MTDEEMRLSALAAQAGENQLLTQTPNHSGAPAQAADSVAASLPVPEMPLIARPMPRLGRGFTWSEILKEMEEDHRKWLD